MKGLKAPHHRPLYESAQEALHSRFTMTFPSHFRRTVPLVTNPTHTPPRRTAPHHTTPHSALAAQREVKPAVVVL